MTGDDPQNRPEQGDRGRRRGRWWPWILLGLGAGVVILVADAVAGENALRLVYLVILLLFVGAGVWWAFMRGNLSRSLRHAAVWVVIGAVLVVGYSFRDQIQFVTDRVIADHVPGYGFDADDNQVSFRLGPDGHFHVTALVDGVEVLFLVDTGASDVILTEEDARRLGFDPARLNYSQVFSTANGLVRGAPVRLNRVAIGPVFVTNVQASVNEASMDRSLLGMSFLSRIGGYQVRGEVLTLMAQ
ncbi:MAG: TIGR02281 family clan AA aspartic protease [Pseudomonadota bacterium]